MKMLASASLLVVGTAFLTFACISFGLFPRGATAANPTLLVEAIAGAGVLFMGLGGRGLYRMHQALRFPARGVP